MNILVDNNHITILIVISIAINIFINIVIYIAISLVMNIVRLACAACAVRGRVLALTLRVAGHDWQHHSSPN